MMMMTAITRMMKRNGLLAILVWRQHSSERNLFYAGTKNASVLIASNPGESR